MKQLLAAMPVLALMSCNGGSGAAYAGEIVRVDDAVCASREVHSTDEMLNALRANFPQDNLYVFAGEDYLKITAALAMSGDMARAEVGVSDEVIVSDGPGGEGGAVLIFFMGDCFTGKVLMSSDAFKALAASAFGPDGYSPVSVKVHHPFNGRDGDMLFI